MKLTAQTGLKFPASHWSFSPTTDDKSTGEPSEVTLRLHVMNSFVQLFDWSRVKKSMKNGDLL